MDRFQLMCWFFFFFHSARINSSLLLWLTRDRQSNEPKKERAEHVYLFFSAYAATYSTHDLLRGSKLKANFTNMSCIHYLPNGVCTEDEKCIAGSSCSLVEMLMLYIQYIRNIKYGAFLYWIGPFSLVFYIWYKLCSVYFTRWGFKLYQN